MPSYPCSGTATEETVTSAWTPGETALFGVGLTRSVVQLEVLAALRNTSTGHQPAFPLQQLSPQASRSSRVVLILCDEGALRPWRPCQACRRIVPQDRPAGTVEQITRMHVYRSTSLS